MATTITINVTNNSPSNQNFFFFQQPASYTGGPTVYSNSLYSATLLPYATSGSVLTFSLTVQYYAGVQQQVATPQVGQPSGVLSASQPIGLTAADGTQTNNTTNMVVSPSLGLTVPTYTSGPQAGSYRIVTPTYNPALTNYNAGSAVRTMTGGVTLSNFVTASPLSNVDCQPILKFYVQTGTYTAGTVMNFTSSSVNAAVCDFTPGYTVYNISYNADGTWTSTPFALMNTNFDKPEAVSLQAAPANAEIRNEAGTAVICTGYAANFNDPITVQYLTNAAALSIGGEYMVGPVGGALRGVMCTALANNAATFS